MSNTRKPKNDVRAALAKKARRTDSFDLKMDDGVGAALARYQRAVQIDDVARMGDDAGTQASTGKARDAAEAEYLKHVHRLDLQSIPAEEYVALETEHPKAADDETPLYEQPFYLHLLAACVVDSDLTADEWRDALMKTNFDVGEVNDLLLKVGLLNTRLSSGEIPKK